MRDKPWYKDFIASTQLALYLSFTTPRITLWRKLKKLGVAQLADGVAALPADARTREQFEWLAEEVVESGGQAGV